MKLLKIIGLISLFHAGYSSYEFTQSQKSYSTSLPYPKDIILEVFISLLILTIDLFLSPNKSNLSLINDDSVKNEYKLRPILMKDAVVEDEKLGAGPFKFVESRTTFIDVNAKRKQYAEWAAKNEELKDEKLSQEKSDEKKNDDEKTEKVNVEEKETSVKKDEVKEELKKDEVKEDKNQVTKNNNKKGKKSKKV